MSELSPRVDAKNDNCNQSIIDYSFKGMILPEDILDYEPRTKNTKLGKNSNGKFSTQTIKLNNNRMTEMTNLHVTLEKIIESPGDLTWIDLSFNDFSKIDPLILRYPKLKVLYLHGNSISSLVEVEKLVGLSQLIALTLHGNPLEDQKGYRQSVVAKLAQLKKLDFSAITKSDRQNAATWQRAYSERRMVKKSKPDE